MGHNYEDVCKKHVPSKSKTFSLYKKPTKERKLLNRRRRKVKNHLQWNQLKPNQKKKYQDELTTIEKKLQKTYRKTTLESATKAIKKNSKFFFNYAKRFSKVKTTIGPLLKKDGEYTMDNEDMAEILSKQYSDVFSKPKTTL